MGMRHVNRLFCGIPLYGYTLKNCIASLYQRLFDLKHSHFVRNVVIVASGAAGAQAISMAASPLITRLFGPETFGVLGTFSALVAVVSPLAAFAYPKAIVLPRNDEEAFGIAMISVFLSFTVALILAIILWIWGDLLEDSIGIQVTGIFIFFLPLSLLFTGLYKIAQQWLIRKRQFSSAARATVLHSFILNFTKVGAGLFYPTAGILIGLQAIGGALYAGLLGLAIRSGKTLSGERKEEGNEDCRAGWLELAKRYYDFPLYRAPQDFINAASQSLPVLMLASLFGPVAAGFYALGMIVMGMPSSLIGKSVNDVFFPKINEAANQGKNLTRLILKATGGLALIGIVPFTTVVVFGPWLFKWVFGLDWGGAGEYARWLALFFFFNFINKPCVASVPVLRLQKGLLFYEVFSTASKVAGLLVGFYVYNSDLVAVALFSVIGVLAYSAMMIWIIKEAKKRGSHGQASR